MIQAELDRIVNAAFAEDLPGGPKDDIGRLEVAARIIAQIPEPRNHLIHDYGGYANAARAKPERDATTEGDSQTATATAPAGTRNDVTIITDNDVSDEANGIFTHLKT